MTYSLSSFDQRFWQDENLGKYNGKPISIYEALNAMPDDKWDDMCNHLFPKIPTEIIDIEMVMDRIKATDTCTNLSNPVEVWIDKDGDFRIQVYEDQDGRQ